MNTRGVKLLFFGLIITLFSLMLVFAGFVSLLLDVAVRAVKTFDPFGGEVYIIVVLAVTAGIGGLFVAWFGLNRND